MGLGQWNQDTQPHGWLICSKSSKIPDSICSSLLASQHLTQTVMPGLNKNLNKKSKALKMRADEGQMGWLQRDCKDAMIWLPVRYSISLPFLLLHSPVDFPFKPEDYFISAFILSCSPQVGGFSSLWNSAVTQRMVGLARPSKAHPSSAATAWSGSALSCVHDLLT